YWTVTADGTVSDFGAAASLGSMPTPSGPNSTAGLANLPPDPNFLAACYPHNTGSACISQITAATTAARAAEGLGPMRLPWNFLALTPAQQLFVVTNVERVDRGLPPFVGLVDQLDADAQAGAQLNTDPGPTHPPPGMQVLGWGSNWAEHGNPLGSNYFWMYDDRPGSGNV